jgi:ligand-binding SRPBCC domain-containing protein
MRIHKLHKEQFIRRPLAEVFSFFEKPENLARITPPWLGFRIITPSPIFMRKGTTIEYSIRVMGPRMTWKSMISEYAPPVRFVDEQVAGPYAFWYHTHTFIALDGGTLVTDDVRYALPLGVLGSVVHRLAVRRQLESIFSYRAGVIEEILGEGEFIGDQLSPGSSSGMGNHQKEEYAHAT